MCRLIKILTIILMTWYAVDSRCSKVEFWFKYLGLDPKACRYEEKKNSNLLNRVKPNINQFHHYSSFQLPPHLRHFYPFYYSTQQLNEASDSILQQSGYNHKHEHEPNKENNDDTQLSEGRESRIDKVFEVIGNFLGDVVGVIISETIRKFGERVSDLARYIVSRSSRFLLRKSGALFANALQTLRVSLRSYDYSYYYV